MGQGNQRSKSLLALLLCLCLILTGMNSMTFAEMSSSEDTGLCVHHPKHTQACGYIEAVKGSPCTHAHTEACSEGCIHTHDENCGYKEATAGRPCSFVCKECEEETRISAKKMSDWSWIDPEETLIYDKEQKVWGLGLPGADKDHPVTKKVLQEMLPNEITAVLEDGTEETLKVTWNFEGFPDKGSYKGSYTLLAAPPEGYMLTEAAPALEVILDLGGGRTLVDQETLQKHIVTESVADPASTTVNLFDYWVNASGEDPSASTTPKGDLLTKDHYHIREKPSAWGRKSPYSSKNDWWRGINAGHLLLFGDGMIHGGLWNKGAGESTAYGQKYAGMEGIVEPVLTNGYPTVNTAAAKNKLLNDQSKRDWTLVGDYKLAGDHIEQKDPSDSTAYTYDGNDIQNLSNTLIQAWEDANSKSIESDKESLDYLFDPAVNNSYKKSYQNVKGLFQLDDEGYYFYNMRQNFAEFQKKPASVLSDRAGEQVETHSDGSFVLYDAPATVRSDGTNSIGNFFPFNTGEQAFSGVDADEKLTSDVACSGNAMNHHFGMSVSLDFRQAVNGVINQGSKNNAMTFEFTGDDDVWIFIDDVLVLDLGGVHSEIYGIIDFKTGKVFTGRAYGQKGIPSYTSGETPADCTTETTLKQLFTDAKQASSTSWRNNTFASNTNHTLRMFYLERGNYDSSLALRFNLQPQLYQQIKKVDQNGNPIEGVEFELFQAERKADGSYEKTGDALTTLTTESDGNAKFAELNADGEMIPFNFTDRYWENHIETYILKEVKAPDGYRMLPVDVVLQYDPDTTMMTVVNRYTTGSYASFLSMITGNNRINYGAYDMATGVIKPDEQKPVSVGSQKNGLIVAIPTLWQKNEQAWHALYGSNTEGLHTSMPRKNIDLMEWRRAALMAALYQCSDNKGTTPHWYLEWNDDNKRLEGVLSDLPGMANRYQLNNPDGDMRMTYAMIEPAALASLHDDGIDGAADSEARYGALGAYIRRQIDGGKTLEEAVGYTADQIMGVAVPENGSGRGFSLLNVDEFSRTFRSLIYIPNEQRELRVKKVDQDGKAINGAVFGLYEDEACTQLVTRGTTATVDGQEGQLIFTPTCPAGAKEGYAEVKWANSANTEYYLQEISAPAGYNVNSTVVPVIVGIYSIYADAGTKEDGVTVMAGVGKLAQTMSKYASDGDVNITLRDITATAQIQKSGKFDLKGWNDLMLDGTDLARTMNLHYGKNAVVDYGLHDEDGGRQLLPFFVTDTGFIRARVNQNTASLDGTGMYDGADNSVNFDRITDDITSLFSLLNIVVVTDQTKDDTKTGELTISKKVAGVVNSPKDYTQNFNFHIKLVDADGNPLSGSFYFYGTDKAGHIKHGDTIPLHHDESITILGLPDGTRYTVTEEDAAGWNVVPTSGEQGGTIYNGETSTAGFTNTRGAIVSEGSLTIRKTVMDGDTEKDGVFSFMINLSDAEGKPLDGKYSYFGSKTGKISNGETISLSHGQSVTIEGIPAGTKYTVSEASQKGWHVLPADGVLNGTIRQGAISYAGFYNTKLDLPENGNLSIEKAVTGTQASHTKSFIFQITLTDDTGKALTESFNYTGARSGRIKSGDTIALKHGERILIMGLPAGTQYRITENTTDGYTSLPSKHTGKIEGNVTAEASFENRSGDVTPEKEHGNLTISKIVTGKGDKDKLFPFTLRLTDEEGNELKDIFAYDGAKSGSITSGGMIFLKDGESVTIHNLPVKTGYEVTESDNEGYSVSKLGDTGKIQNGVSASAVFQNHIPIPTSPSDDKFGTLTISKVVSGAGGETDREFAFSIELTDGLGNVLTGAYSYEGSKTGTVKTGDTIMLKHGESITINNLPADTSYTVTEQTPKGYKVNKKKQSGKIAERKDETVVFVNTKQKPDKPVKPSDPTDPKNPSHPKTPEDSSNTGHGPSTGDHNHVLLWLLIFICSIGGVFTVFFAHKAARRKE